jgi:hypothetical protein
LEIVQAASLPLRRPLVVPPNRRELSPFSTPEMIDDAPVPMPQCRPRGTLSFRTRNESEMLPCFLFPKPPYSFPRELSTLILPSLSGHPIYLTEHESFHFEGSLRDRKLIGMPLRSPATPFRRLGSLREWLPPAVLCRLPLLRA